MTTTNLGRWLLVGFAIIGLAVAGPVSAHGDATTATDTQVDNESDGTWGTWMEAQMTDHMGPDAIAWMESHIGVGETGHDTVVADPHAETLREDRVDGNEVDQIHGQDEIDDHPDTAPAQGHTYGPGHC